MPDPGSKLVCATCVREEFLQEEVEKHPAGLCSYCGSVGNAVPVEWLARRVGAVLNDFYFFVGSPWKTSRRLIEVIGGEAEVEGDVAEDVRLVLQKESELEAASPGANYFGPDTHYDQSVNSLEMEFEWSDFDLSLRHKNRFFNRSGEDLMQRLFAGIDGHSAAQGRDVIVEAGPGTGLAVLHRARVFEDSEKLDKAVRRPDVNLGPPPDNESRAGRMNATGIRVFYGATTADVALAEVRPPVGSKVLVGRFSIMTPLRLLDLTALAGIRDPEGSRFDPAHVKQVKRTHFLRTLGDRLARPVLPRDESLSFLPTQAVADYLATAITPPLDGVIYPSVQVGAPQTRYVLGGSPATHGRNVVLFSHAARVKQMKDPKGLSSSSSPFTLTSRERQVRMEDPECEYIVRYPPGQAHDPDSDEPLRVDELTLFTIKGVSYEKSSSGIIRGSMPEENSVEDPEAGAQTVGGEEPAVR